MSEMVTSLGTLHYERHVLPGAPVLVFANSLGTDLRMWEAQIALRGRIELLFFDERGQGQSTVPAAPYSIVDMAEDVIALLDHLGYTEEVHFCGLSMGGMVGQWLALHAPERFRSFTLSNTAAKIGTKESWDARIQAVTEDGMTILLPAILNRWFTEEYQRIHPEVVRRIKRMLLGTKPEGYVQGCAAIRDFDLRQEVREIRKPVLVVCGSRDPVTTVEDANFLANSIAGTEIACLEAAHLSNVEQSSRFTQVLEDFVQRMHKGANHG